MIVFDTLVIIFCLFFGFNFKNHFKFLNAYDRRLLNKLFFFHLFFSVIFYLFISTQGGDATNYWFKTYEYRNYNFDNVIELIGRGSATGFLLLFNYLPAKILGISFFAGNILYGLIGYIGFVYFYIIIKTRAPYIYSLRYKKVMGYSIFPMFFFLPNLHFWSAGIGKDTFLFFCIAFFIFSIGNIKKHFAKIMLCVLLSMAIRPHITLYLILSFTIAYTLDGRLKSYQKFSIFVLLGIASVPLLNYVMQFAQLESLDLETVNQYTSEKASSLSSGAGSGVDIANYPYPFKIFTFLFRPLFLDATSVIGIIASIENLILLIFSFKIMKARPLKAFKSAPYVIKTLALFFLLGSFTFPLILSNLGIILRQKTPFILCFIVFGIYVLQQKKLNQNFR